MIVPVAIGLGLLYILAKGSAIKEAAENFRYRFIELLLDRKKSGLTHLNFVLRIEIENVKDTKVKLDFIKGDLIYAGQSIAKFEIKEADGKPIVVEGKQKARFNIPVSTNNLSIVTAILKSINDKKLSTEVQYKGEISMGGVIVPVHHKFQLKELL
ncbi:MAG: LEA type 2 family protein [Bacteroidia bacterium]|nr:LEA type 2 family protein [Bacteroidia bacterium]